LVSAAIQRAHHDNVVYLELRFGPRGFLGRGDLSFPEFVSAVASAVSQAEDSLGITTRCILGIPRHVFAKVPSSLRDRMLMSILQTVDQFRGGCFVGVDLNGDETAGGAELFKLFFEKAAAIGLGTTVHAGEVGPVENIQYAARELKAKRIGHGLAAASDTSTLALLRQLRCALELCPTSNVFLGLAPRISSLPLRLLIDSGVPLAICTDNPARCDTTLSEELYKVAVALDLNIDQVCDLNSAALNLAFADLPTKDRVKRQLMGYKS
jgi:adenosine deaminase